MIAPIIGNKVLPPIVFSLEDGKTKKVNGINDEMSIDYIESILCPAINLLNPFLKYLVVDKSNIHNVSKIRQALHNGFGVDSIEILIIPSQTAKRLNPSMDNALFYEWKERIRNRSFLTEETVVATMENKWFATPKININNYYNNCSVTRGQNVYSDCPSSSNHRHW